MIFFERNFSVMLAFERLAVAFKIKKLANV